MAQSKAFTIQADHPALAGHFPGNPVVPGVVVLQEVLRFAMAVDSRWRIMGVDGVKSLRPLRPHQAFCIVLEAEAGSRRRFECRSEEQCIALGYLILELNVR